MAIHKSPINDKQKEIIKLQLEGIERYIYMIELTGTY